MKANNNFGKWLQEQRENKHVTQTEFAMACHLSRMSISSFENGNTKPGLKAAKKIANALDVDLETIIALIK